MSSLYNPGSAFRISSPFGPRNPADPPAASKFHEGIDFAAPLGTPIKAAADGNVYYTGAASGFGNVVILEHVGNDGETYYTLYGHMNSLMQFTKNEPVAIGQTIGLVGNKGISGGPHLHFETIDGETAFNNAINGKSTGIKGYVNRINPEKFDFHGSPVYDGGVGLPLTGIPAAGLPPPGLPLQQPGIPNAKPQQSGVPGGPSNLPGIPGQKGGFNTRIPGSDVILRPSFIPYGNGGAPVFDDTPPDSPLGNIFSNDGSVDPGTSYLRPSLQYTDDPTGQAEAETAISKVAGPAGGFASQGNIATTPSSDPIQDVLNSASGALNSLSDAIASFVPTISGSNPSPSGNIATPLVTDPGAGGNHLGSVLGTESKNVFGEIVGEVVNTVVNTVINLISSALGWLPVVLDLTGKGINITQETSSNTFFDGAGDGEQHQTAWAGAGNAVLFYDPTGTGSLTRADQVVFTDLDPSASNDMQALEDVFDTNHSGSLDAGDASYGNFYLDVTNANGTHTIESLTQAGITAINLTPNAVNQKLPDGSAIQGETTYTTSSGSTGAAATVSFAADATGYAVGSTTSAIRRNRVSGARARRRGCRNEPRRTSWRLGHRMQPENLIVPPRARPG